MKKDTPMMKQYFKFKEKHPDKFIFFRVGEFYELFDEDAIQAAKILHITLTQRHTIPMCGIPQHQLDNYSPKMLKEGKKIVIVEQMENPKEVKGIVKRDITQIMTPGTVTDDFNLIENENNYLACMFLPKYDFSSNSTLGELIFSVLDFSTGESEIHYFQSKNLKADIESLMNRYSPKELLVSNQIDLNSFKKNFFYEDPSFIINPLPEYLFEKEYAQNKIKQIFKTITLKGIGLDDHPYLPSVFCPFIYYINETQKSSLEHLKIPHFIKKNENMLLDSATQKNLEVIKNNRDETKRNSLLWILDKTISSAGSRLKKKIILNPLLSLEKIKKRQENINFFFNSKELLMKIRERLKNIYDIERLSSRLSLKRILPREIIALKNSLKVASNIFDYLKENKAPFIIPKQTEILFQTISTIEKTLIEQPDNTLKKGNLIKPHFNETLDHYKNLLSKGHQFLIELQQKEREKTKIPSLKIKYNDNFGYFFEITKTHINKVPSYFIKKQTLVSADRFTTKELISYQDKILQAERQSFELEHSIYLELMSNLKNNVSFFQEISNCCSYIDVIASFAYLAMIHHYVKPKITEGTKIEIINGRHPVIEKVNDFDFISNSLCIGGEESLVHIVSGPNMAGKSTFLRQNALIILMAQIGSFIPAEKAEIAICDRIFTRIGASDNLAKGESTFLVEMSETAYILNHATPKSFIIMDEIGRGTSTYDGLSLAWSILEYIVTNKKCYSKTLFATHYHELVILAESFNKIKNYTMQIKEDENRLIFLKKAVLGISNKSYGVHVAGLAGMPKTILEKANYILAALEKKKKPHLKKEIDKKEQQDISLEILEVLYTIKTLKIDQTSPKKAFLILEEIQRKMLDFYI